MSQSAIDAYVSLLPKLAFRNRKVYNAAIVLNGVATNRELASHLGWERDSVSPRSANLMRLGLFCKVGVKNGETLWSVRDPRNAVPVGPARSRETYEVEVLQATEINAGAQDENYMIVSVKIRPRDPRWAQSGARIKVEALP